MKIISMIGTKKWIRQEIIHNIDRARFGLHTMHMNQSIIKIKEEGMRRTEEKSRTRMLAIDIAIACSMFNFYFPLM